jgi:hypothetical protein
MRRKQKQSPDFVARLIADREKLYPDSVKNLESAWKNAEQGIPAERPKQIKTKSCSCCKKRFDSQYQGDYGIAQNPDTDPYELKERHLFLAKDICLECLEKVESKS